MDDSFDGNSAAEAAETAEEEGALAEGNAVQPHRVLTFVTARPLDGERKHVLLPDVCEALAKRRRRRHLAVLGLAQRMTPEEIDRRRLLRPRGVGVGYGGVREADTPLEAERGLGCAAVSMRCLPPLILDACRKNQRIR